MFRDSESVGRRLRAVPSAPGIPGPGDDQRRLCVLAGPSRLRRRGRHHSRSEPCLHRSIAAAVDLPVSADFMSGYGLEPEDVAESVARCVATGVAGLSIEDSTGDPASPLYDLPLAVERVRAARQAIDRSGEDVLLTARAECYHVGHPDPFPETVRRLQAYAAAGADVLFAPGPQNAGGNQGARRGGRTEAIQPSRGSGHWPACRRDRGARRATHQRRRRAGAGGVDRLHARRTDVEVGGQFRRTGEPGAIRRDQRPLCD